jgi:hypothetical protein
VNIKDTLINIDNIAHLSTADFEQVAMNTFQYQYIHNSIYHQYCSLLHVHMHDVQRIEQIPFLPIHFFKTHKVLSHQPSGDEVLFESSKTTGDVSSKHYVTDIALYNKVLLHGFRTTYGSPSDYAILGLLPSYLERPNASLVHMVKELMLHSSHPANGFYVHNFEDLRNKLQILEGQQQKTLLIGVTFALLDFAEAYPMQLSHTTVMETGGMKGRKEEWTRAQVHQYLKQQLGLTDIHTEYGMTELLSQAYAQGNGILKGISSFRALIRDINDPLSVSTTGSGCLNIIDLANVHSCSFIATEDIGHVYADGSFEILGRMDHSALRGCSLMSL